MLTQLKIYLHSGNILTVPNVAEWRIVYSASGDIDEIVITKKIDGNRPRGLILETLDLSRIEAIVEIKNDAEVTYERIANNT